MRKQNELDVLRRNLELVKQDVNKRTEERILSIIKKFFEEFPEVKSFYWNQYTPSFNDGDPCYFTYYGLDSESISLEENIDDNWFTSLNGKKAVQSLGALDDELNMATESLEDIFGRGRIMVYKNVIERRDYGD